MSGQDVSCQNFNTVFVEYAQNLRYALTFKKKYDTLNLYEFF
ncbi:unknown [Ruminococcus sp. CAG:254]|nr:unknown [Ruminococcus sp. CAG:254]